MHFSHLNNGSASKATKIAVVASVHVLLAIGLIHSINTRTITMPKVAKDLVVMMTPDLKPPPPPPEPPKPMPKVAPPDIVVPKVEVETPPPPEQPQVQATTEPDPTPAEPAQTQSVEAPPAQSDARPGEMRNAVFADANGCAKPQYPMDALRREESGTVTLALLIGPDGKVSSSRIEHSSGYRELDKAAVNALSLCTFKPAMNNGTPAAGWAKLAYVWNLD
jgi:periplasmic protein TonB